jgi:thiol-disulfide isomerase/thioredoxin
MKTMLSSLKVFALVFLTIVCFYELDFLIHHKLHLILHNKLEPLFSHWYFYESLFLRGVDFIIALTGYLLFKYYKRRPNYSEDLLFIFSIPALFSFYLIGTRTLGSYFFESCFTPEYFAWEKIVIWFIQVFSWVYVIYFTLYILKNLSRRYMLVFLLAFIIFLGFLAAFYAGWIGQSSLNSEKYLFSSKTKSWIKLKVSTDDTLSIDQRFFTRFPLYSNDKTYKISGDSNLNIRVTANNPGHAEFRMGNKMFRVFIYPGDTSSVELNKKGDQITWNSPLNAKNSRLINYYFNKDKTMGYDNQWQILSFQYSIGDFCNKADLLYSREMQYFDSCNSQSPFPEWFQQYERNDILYFNARAKLSAIYYRNKYLDDTTAYEISNQYFLDSILINNERAILSPNYFEFLNSYTIHIGNKELFQLKHMDHAFRVIKIFEDSLSWQLDKNISDKYFIKITSDIISHLPSAYIGYNLDTNNLYPIVDTILLSATERELEPEYIDYLNGFYENLKEIARNVKLLTKGDKAPDFYLKAEKGGYYHLKDFGGKIVMLNFWAEYCLPCLNTVPQKNEIVELFSEDDFVLINIFLTSKEDVWKKLIQEKGMKGTNLICKGKWAKILMDGYNIHAIPAYALIDKNGNIIQNRIDGLEKVKTIISKHIM